VNRRLPDELLSRATLRPALPLKRSFTREVQARVERLGGVSTTVLGSAADSAGARPILACVARADGARDCPGVLISAGVHGDEIAGVFAALEFLETQTRTVSRRFPIAVLPCINPSGFELDRLETADGANINRLFGTGSQQPEVVAVESWLEQSRCRFLATFDLHEVSPRYRGEGFVESDNPDACFLYETQADRARRIGPALIDVLPPSIEVCQWPRVYLDLNDNGVVSYPEACNNPIYARQTTFDAYLNGRFTPHSFTFETPMGWSLENRVQTHLLWLEAALSRLGDERRD
jgi:hypothetical protein